MRRALTLDDEKIIISLVNLGLPKSEARLYTLLLNNPGLSLRELSERTNVSVARVYKLLSSLYCKGLLVIVKSKHNKRFSVIPPVTATSVLVRRYEEKFYEALKRRNELLTDLKNIESISLADSLSYEFADRHTVMGIIRKFIRDSRREISIIATAGCLTRLAYYTAAELREARARGVKIRIIAPLSQVPQEIFNEATTWGECKETNTVTAKILIRDSEEALMIPGKETLTQRIDYERGIYINNRDIVYILNSMFLSFWRTADNSKK